MSSDRLSLERLADWLEGRLTEEEARAVAGEAARAQGEDLRRLQWLRSWLTASGEVRMGSPSPELREVLARRFTERGRGGRALRRIVAVLTGGRGAAPAAGFRGATEVQGTYRYMVYTSEAADIAINLHPRSEEGTVDLDGQVLPRDRSEPESFSVQLLCAGLPYEATVADDLGEFSFERIERGAYELVLESEEVRISVPELELRP